MTRELTPNRWNWSQEDNKWVYIENKDNGRVIYHYRINPPKEFNELNLEIRLLNDKLLVCKDPEENANIFKEMMKASKRMQFMTKMC